MEVAQSECILITRSITSFIDQLIWSKLHSKKVAILQNSAEFSQILPEFLRILQNSADTLVKSAEFYWLLNDVLQNSIEC